MLNYECDADDCGHNGYAHVGGACEKKWLRSIESAPGPVAAPVPVPPGDPQNPPLGATANARKSATLLG
ncbi:hypothetical protein LJR129_002480 [Acidovorax sp. LjRoot129]